MSTFTSRSSRSSQSALNRVVRPAPGPSLGGDHDRGGEGGARRLTVTVEEAAVLLGVSRSSAYQAVRTGELPARRLGRRLVIPAAALTRWLEGDPAAGDATDAR
jgi:excisionase family DNA binding protein